MRYDVSVITVNYNSSEFTVACVRTLLKQTADSLNFNVIVVDNNSEPQDFEKLDVLNRFENVSVVRSNINLGFAGGNMFGLQFTRANYYFFLNNDCLLLNDCLSVLFDFCERHSKVGMCSPQLYDEAGKPQPCFDYSPELLSKFLGTGVFRLSRGTAYYPRKQIPQKPIKVEVLSGSQLFVRAEAFAELGGFDTNLFLYCEEEDLAIRMQRQGYDAYLVPAAHNQHHGGASTARSYAIQQEFYISFLYFYRKHYGFVKSQLLKFLLFLRRLKKVRREPHSFRLALFILSGAHMKHSLRHQQKIRQLD